MTELSPKRNEQGFTLIELSIVLVIIGLIVGGVLVGQDLIKAAEVRATVGQVEKYNSAVNTFRTKYNTMPGDVASGAAQSFGLVSRTGAAGHGDGNSLLEGCSAGAVVFGCETALFWRDMSFANLVEQTFNTATDALGNAGAAIAAGEVPLFFPGAKIGRGNYFAVFSNGGLNYYQITGITATTNAGVYTLVEAITPQEAFNMDNKVDDGSPLTGIGRAMEGTGPLNTAAAAAAPAAGVCVANTTGSPYNTGTAALANEPACEMRFRFN